MTTDVKIGERFRPVSATPSPASGPAPVPAALSACAANIRTRRGQTLALTFEGTEAVFVVRTGTLMLHLTLPDGSRQVVSILYPGDVLRSAFVPPHTGALLSGVSAGEVLRLRWNVFGELAARDGEVARYFEDALARQTALQAIHMAAVGRLDCRQRVATFLIELALRSGVAAPCGGVAFEMPLTRIDMADYLGLNADTLSRTMSGLKASGFVSHSERHRAVVRDFDALAALTPAARSLMALCGGRPADPAP